MLAETDQKRSEKRRRIWKGRELSVVHPSENVSAVYFEHFWTSRAYFMTYMMNKKELLASPATLGAYRTIRNITHICLDSALWATHVGGLNEGVFSISKVLSAAGSHRKK